MFRFAFQRPIAILTSFVVIIIFSVVAFVHLPISLLPEVDVPQIIVKTNYPNASPAEVEQNVLRPIREGLLTLSHLKNVESKAYSEQGQVALFFEYDAPMDLAYIETNEKIDQLTGRLPKGLNRPQVVKINTSDIPIVRLQIVPKDAKDLQDISLFTEKVIKKRLEALEGVSLVDVNGLTQKSVFVQTFPEAMQALGVNEADLSRAIQESNRELGTISVKDGQYRYFLKLASKLKTLDDIQKIQIRTTKGNIVPLTQIASVKDTIERRQGFHTFNQQEGLVITIHKQAQARMPELMEQIDESVKVFETEYPHVTFQLTQNQSTLLDAAISNLQSDLVFGGFFAFLMLFLFIGNYRVPFLIGVILPTSLLMSFLIFYVFGTSINIISLSGLALGLGMTIDNAIIIFDHIGKKRLEGLPLLEACVKGTAEMTPPLISSALTTQAVFIPLIFLDDLAGALSYDQAVAVGSILFTSLIVSFFLLPLLYILLFRNSKTLPKEDNRLYKTVLKGYKKLYDWLFKRRKWVFPTLLLAGLLGLGISLFLKVEGLPEIERTDLMCDINWNEPISVEENKRRLLETAEVFKGKYTLTESDIGIQQFLLQNKNTSLQQAQLYILCENSQVKNQLGMALRDYLKSHFPQATVAVKDAPNTFDLLFQQQKPYFEVRWQNRNALQPIPATTLLPTSDSLIGQFPSFQKGEGMQQETQVEALIDLQKLNLYGVSYEQFVQKLQNILGNQQITEIQNFSEQYAIRFADEKKSFEEKVNNSFIQIDSSKVYPLETFLTYRFVKDYKMLTADKTGIYHSLEAKNIENSQAITQRAETIALQQTWQVKLEGQYFDNQDRLWQLIFILVVSILLLYFILTVEFESFRQPLIVIFTLPLGFTGSFLMLWLAGESLNIMSAIGLVVMLGIIDNESILKIDTINRLRKELPFEEAIYKAGEVCFKPVLMTSLTNILALTPFLFDSGIGADLQRPFVLAIIGGLSIGTFTALYFVPFMYYYLMRKKESKSTEVSEYK